MNCYIQKHLGVSSTKASSLRQTYWDQYGATLRGLIRHHNVDPKDFLKKTHDLAFHDDHIIFENLIHQIFRKLRGRKIIFTNAPQRYTTIILKKMNVHHFFDFIHAIEHSKFHGKPSTLSIKKLIRNTKTKQAYFVDDTLANLKKAKQYGLKTIWINGSLKKPSFIDFKIKNINAMRRLRIKPV
jgi:putative hydrolase of the HAD superfamily